MNNANTVGQASSLPNSVVGQAGSLPHPCTPCIGCVPYLNAKPLIYGLEKEVVFDHPSRLAARLAAGELDVALVPVVECFRRPGYVIADGIAIACEGPVKSVFLAHHQPLEQVRQVVVDASSGTSALLLRVLLEKHLGLKPAYIRQALATQISRATAQMLIGDQALRFLDHTEQLHRRHRGLWKILDLGQAWFDWTGLPFVFAVWAIRADYADPRGLAGKLTAAREAGLANLKTIIAREQVMNETERRQYFAENVRFGLGPQEKEAMRLFQQHLVELGELKERAELRFISAKS